MKPFGVSIFPRRDTIQGRGIAIVPHDTGILCSIKDRTRVSAAAKSRVEVTAAGLWAEQIDCLAQQDRLVARGHRVNGRLKRRDEHPKIRGRRRLKTKRREPRG